MVPSIYEYPNSNICAVGPLKRGNVPRESKVVRMGSEIERARRQDEGRRGKNIGDRLRRLYSLTVNRTSEL